MVGLADNHRPNSALSDARRGKWLRRAAAEQRSTSEFLPCCVTASWRLAAASRSPQVNTAGRAGRGRGRAGRASRGRAALLVSKTASAKCHSSLDYTANAKSPTSLRCPNPCAWISSRWSNVNDMRLDDMNNRAITKRRLSVSPQIKVRQVLAICSIGQNDSTTLL